MAEENTEATEKIEKKTASTLNDSPTTTAADLEAHAKNLRQACSEEITMVLKKYNCTFEAQVLITAKGNIPRVVIVHESDKK